MLSGHAAQIISQRRVKIDSFEDDKDTDVILMLVSTGQLEIFSVDSDKC